MPKQVNAVIGESIYFDPGAAAGPYTILFPDPLTLFDAAFFRLVTTSASITEIVLDGNGVNIRTAEQGAAPTLTVRASGAAIRMEYNEGSDEWQVTSGFDVDSLFLPDIYDNAVITPLNAVTLTSLPQVLLIGAEQRFVINGSGILEAIVPLPIIVLESTVLIDMTAAANNEETNLIFDYIYTGVGTKIAAAGLFPFQTSRTGTFQATLRSEFVALNVGVGDTIDVVAGQTLGDTMTANALAWLVNVPSSARFPLVP